MKTSKTSQKPFQSRGSRSKRFNDAKAETCQNKTQRENKKEVISSSEDIFSNTYHVLANHEFDQYKITTPSDIQKTASIKGGYMTSNTQKAINLEDLCIQEDKLWKILDSIRCNYNFNYAAEEYLEFSHISSIQSFDCFFSNQILKVALNTAMVYEYISASICLFIYMKNKLNKLTVDHLKNILYYVHQNLLLIFKMILKRMSKDYTGNIWANKMQSLINRKKSVLMTIKEEFQLQQNNDILNNMIENFSMIYFNNAIDGRIFAIINEILININNCSIESVKNNVNNLKNMIIHCAENNQNNLFHMNLPGPFLPPIDKKYTYTLVLDLDETLIHSLEQHDSYPLIRPGALTFLEELSPYYEIVIFTAALQDYADSIIQLLDKDKHYIQHRLYRQHTTVLKKSYLKDIAKLGRDLSKVIIIDNARDNFQLQNDNGIFITTWIDDEKDRELLDLIPILKEIPIKKVSDVRKALRYIRDTMIRFYVKGDNAPYNTIKSIIKHQTVSS